MCDDAWDTTDAQVACRQLGLNVTGASALEGDAAPVGRGQIWLDDVQCTGMESSLFNCTANPLGDHNCGHFEDAGVICPGEQC